MAKEGYTVEDIYQGGYSSFNSDYGSIFTGYHIPAGQLGAPTKPDTANQIQHVANMLNQGIVPIEIGALSPEVFDQIPKQHFKEINRMAKLSGAKISVHAPIVEASGIGEQGWNESNRQLAEWQLNDVVEKAIELDDKGGVPITIHSSGQIPGREYKMTPEGKKVEKMIIVDRETGKPAQMLEEEKLYYPEMIKPEIQKKLNRREMTHEELRPEHYVPLEEGKIYSPQDRIEMVNATQWDNQINQLIFNKERADEILQQNYPKMEKLMEARAEGRLTRETLKEYPEQQQMLDHLNNVEIYLQDTRQSVGGLFNKAYKNSKNDEQKEYLKQLSEKFKDDLRKDQSLPGQSAALQGLMLGLKQITPELYTPIEDFALDKSSQTFANVAFNAFEKANKQNKIAPKICVENMFPGMAFAFSDEMSQLITETKRKFVERAKSQGYSESRAKEQADKMIGMTLDVGHLNIARKKGFKEEHLLEEVKKLAPHVKHVHLTDNFGRSDSHLPPGMGNVPFKKILEELEKTGRAEEMRKIVEAGGFVQHFGVSPLPYVLEAMGSPIYSMKMGPYWNQALGFQQGYFSGYGPTLPSGNYSMFGAGFSQLPTELGGQAGGAGGSRMSGRPME